MNRDKLQEKVTELFYNSTVVLVEFFELQLEEKQEEIESLKDKLFKERARNSKPEKSTPNIDGLNLVKDLISPDLLGQLQKAMHRKIPEKDD